MDNAEQRGRAGAEALIVVGCLIILSTLIICWRLALVRKQRMQQAQADIRGVVDAGKHFYEIYDMWPSSQSGRNRDFRYGGKLPNQQVMNVLGALDGPGNWAHQVNPRQINFLRDGVNVSRLVLDEETGDWLDPWGSPYQIVMDTDFNWSCDIERTAYGRVEGVGMAVWSFGPDRESDTPDDVCSWK